MIGHYLKSLLHPQSYSASALRSFMAAVGLALLELPLASMFAILALGAGYDPLWTFAFEAVACLMLVTMVLAGVALAGALILAAVGLYKRLSVYSAA